MSHSNIFDNYDHIHFAPTRFIETNAVYHSGTVVIFKLEQAENYGWSHVFEFTLLLPQFYEEEDKNNNTHGEIFDFIESIQQELLYHVKDKVMFKKENYKERSCIAPLDSTQVKLYSIDSCFEIHTKPSLHHILILNFDYFVQMGE